VSTIEQLDALRRAHWCQTAEDRITGPDGGLQLIDRVGVATLYPASPEIPNLFHAYVGDPSVATDSGHDSPSGEVHSWRWALGGREAAFYSVLVRGRPTWVSWALFPAILRLCGEHRSPDELYDAGEISADAHRVACALDMAGGVLSTAELRRQAGFPTGKPQRAAYLKAVQELDSRLLLAKVFTGGTGEQDMLHALVRSRYPEHTAAAERLAYPAALDAFLATYLPAAVYAVPAVLAKHLRLPEAELRAALDGLVGAGSARRVREPNGRGDHYVWSDV
jgi:hypothetical protein